MDTRLPVRGRHKNVQCCEDEQLSREEVLIEGSSLELLIGRSKCRARTSYCEDRHVLLTV